MNCKRVVPVVLAALAASLALTARAALPDGYCQLSSITSTGTQYIKTDMVPTAATTVEMDFNTGTYANDTTFFGQSWGGSQYLFIKQGNAYKFYGSGASVSPLHNNEDAHLSITAENTLILAYADTAVTSTVSRAASSAAFNIFADSGGGHKGSWTLYTLKIWTGGVLQRDFVPALRAADNAAGLYDLAEGKFYANAGTGAFTKGRVLADDALAISSSAVENCSTPSPAYGTVTGLAAGDTVPVFCGDSPWTNAIGTANYSYAGWKLYDGNGDVLQNGIETSFTYTHPAPATFRRLEWQWARECHVTAVASAGEGTATVSVPWVADGGTSTFTATPAAGYAFSCWMNGSTIVSRDNPYTLTVDAPTTLHAVFTDASSSGWRYDGSGSTKLLTELDPPDGGPAWILKCTVSGQNLTVSGVQQVGANTVLNLRLPIADANGTPYPVVAVGNNALKSNTAITDVLLPDTATTLGYGAFQDCTALTSVTLPQTLTSIGYSAFQGCTALTSVTPFLPISLQSLGYKAFQNCTHLVGDLVLGGNEPFTLGKSGNIGCQFQNTAITSVTMGEGVTTIVSAIFGGCTSLTNAILSSRLERIEEHSVGGVSGAFESCTALRRVTPFLPTTLRYIGHKTFSGCTSLVGDLVFGGEDTLQVRRYGSIGGQFLNTAITSVSMGGGVTYLPPRIFNGCTSLTNVVLSANLRVLDQHTAGGASGAFEGCTALRHVEPLLPESIAYLGHKSFSGCTSLVGDLFIGSDAEGAPAVTNALYGSSTSAYFSNTKIASLTLRSNVTTVPASAFAGLGTLTSLVVRAESPTLGANAFQNTKAVQSVVFDGFPTWQSNTFSGWTNLQSRFFVPARNAGWVAFVADATKLTPWSSIEGTADGDAYVALYGTEELPRGYTVANPAKQWVVTSSADGAGTCELQVAASPEEFGQPSPAYGDHDVTDDVAGGGLVCTAPLYVPNGTNLMKCVSHTVLVFDDATMTWISPVTESGNSFTFTPPQSGSYRLVWNFEVAAHDLEVKSDTAGGVTVARSAAPDLEGFYTPGTVVTLTATDTHGGRFVRWFGDVPEGQGESASITVVMDRPKSVTPYFDREWTYDATAKTISDGYWTIAVTASSTNLTANTVTVRPDLPLVDFGKRVNGGAYRISVLGQKLFINDARLEEVVLPPTLEEFHQVGDGSASGTFQNCTALRKVTPFLPLTLKTIGHKTFSGCTSLTGDLVFGGDAPLTVQNYTQYGDQFRNTAITSVRMGNGITYLPPSVFAGCTSLTNVVLSANLETLAQHSVGGVSGVFEGCSALRHVEPFLPLTLKTIGHKTFSGCPNLTGDLVLGGDAPLSVQLYSNIGSQFRGTAITSVRMGNGITYLPPCVFAGCTSLTNVVLSANLQTMAQHTVGGVSGVFEGCSALCHVEPLLPESLIYLGHKTFSGCTSLEGEVFLGSDAKNASALTFATYGNTTHYFGTTKISALTLRANCATIPVNAFTSLKSVRDVRFDGFPTSIGSGAFTGWDRYQARIWLPSWVDEWTAFREGEGNVSPMTPALLDQYYSRFPGGRRPKGLIAVTFPNQWLLQASKGGTMVIMR
jgi:hypothetical protein